MKEITTVLSRKCKTCRWHERKSWVCSNGLSEHVADFTDNEDVCDRWEEHEPDDNDSDDFAMDNLRSDESGSA